MKGRESFIKFFAVFLVYLGTWGGSKYLLVWSDDFSCPSRIITYTNTPEIHTL